MQVYGGRYTVHVRKVTTPHVMIAGCLYYRVLMDGAGTPKLVFVVAGPAPAVLASHGCLLSEGSPVGRDAVFQPRFPSTVDPVKHVISPRCTMNTCNITQTDFYLQVRDFVISSTCIRKHPILGRDCSTQTKWQRPKGSSLNPIEAAPCKRGCL